MKNTAIFTIFAALMITAMVGCKSGPFNLIKPASPHERYERKLVSAGLSQTAMGTSWLNSATRSLETAINIELPYQEKGYFAAERAEAVAFKFKLIRGEKLQVNVTRKSLNGFVIYLDVWQKADNSPFKWLAAADTLGNSLQLEAEQTGEFILRLQPELLGSGAYTLTINKGPSLGYPLKSENKNQIQSFFGAGRDENTRKHEGIDIFSSFRTPVLAAAPGTITGVNVNTLGGKVVWLRPEGKNYTLYYAHLDEQTVAQGQSVRLGDTLGRMGNTGNAKTTPPHLHFGIYTSDGAVDPLPFVNPFLKDIPSIKANANTLNTTMRTTNNVTIDGASLKAGTVLRVTAATANDYRVELPNGKRGFLFAKSLSSTEKALSKFTVKAMQPVYDQPSDSAAVKRQLQTGQTVAILGSFGGYQLMIDEDQQVGWIKK